MKMRSYAVSSVTGCLIILKYVAIQYIENMPNNITFLAKVRLTLCQILN